MTVRELMAKLIKMDMDLKVFDTFGSELVSASIGFSEKTGEDVVKLF